MNATTDLDELMAEFAELWADFKEQNEAFAKEIFARAEAESKVAALEGQLREERAAHDKIGEYLLPLVGTGDGTSVSAAERAAKKIERLQEALRVETRKAEALLKLGRS